MKALSIRQPWAWLIVNGYKTVENRSRYIGKHAGPFLIHTSKTMTIPDYEACVLFLRSDNRLHHLLDILPPPKAYLHGGIVGQATIDRVNTVAPMLGECRIHLPWYTGEVGYVLRDAKPLPFFPCKGRLGFFDVEYEGFTA